MSKHENTLGVLERVIATHGWAVQAAIHDSDGRPYSYTVGMERFDHPELIITGFDHTQAHLLLNDIGALIANGERFSDWDYSADLVEHYRVWFREIAPSQVPILAKMATIRSKSVRLLHVLMPDAFGHLPWQQTCDGAYRRQLLPADHYLERSVH